MLKLRHYKGLIAFLILSFLGVQANSAHIHLPAHHDHDGSHHQHRSQGHAHNLASHHRDAIDIAPSQIEHNIVELDHECTSPHWSKQDDTTDALTSTNIGHDLFSQLQHIAPVHHPDIRYQRIARPNAQPRAPPLPVVFS